MGSGSINNPDQFLHRSKNILWSKDFLPIAKA
jgi:hypothetical protein